MPDIADDHYDRLYDGTDDDDWGETPSVRCRDCGDEDVYWVKQADGSWALYGINSRRHKCKPEDLSEARLGAFKDLG
jgi:hypothetical protein